MDDISFSTILIFCGITFVGLLLILFYMVFKHYNLDEGQKIKTLQVADTPAEVVERETIIALLTYQRRAKEFQAIYGVLGVIAIISSVYVTTFINGNSKAYIAYVSLTTTASITLLTAFNLGSKANGCKTAWRHLHYAYSQYKTGIIGINDLIKARFEAEAIISGGHLYK